MKLLLHAINGVGLGHVIRTSRIADAFRVLRPDADIVFATNTKYILFLKQRYKSYQLKRDTRDVIEGHLTYDDYLRYNTMAIRKIVSYEQPDMVLFDCELNKELVLFCKENAIKTVYVLRGSTDERFEKIKDALFLFDAVIVPHEQEEIVPSQRAFLEGCRASFTGPILDADTLLKEGERRNILITLGSGARIPQNAPLFSAVDAFLKFLRANDFFIEDQRVSVDMVTGPFYEGGCDLSGVTVRATTDNLIGDMYHSKVVISGAGYNTVNEIISSKTPAVLVPLQRQWDDQFQRAERLKTLGCVEVAYEEIWHPVLKIFREWEHYYGGFPDIKNGVERAAGILSNILAAKKGERD